MGMEGGRRVWEVLTAMKCDTQMYDAAPTSTIHVLH